jgi:hypothetical protein
MKHACSQQANKGCQHDGTKCFSGSIHIFRQCTIRGSISNAEAKLFELQKTLADCSLTDDQVESILKKLNPFAGQEYTVTAYWDSKESLGIANRINSILENAGWRYNPVGSKSSMLGGIVGIQVWTHPDAGESAKQAAKSLIDALNNEGLAAFSELV